MKAEEWISIKEAHRRMQQRANERERVSVQAIREACREQRLNCRRDGDDPRRWLVEARSLAAWHPIRHRPRGWKAT